MTWNNKKPFTPKVPLPFTLCQNLDDFNAVNWDPLATKIKNLIFIKKKLMKSILFSNIPVWGGDLCFRRNVSHAGIVLKTYIVLKILWNTYVKE